MFEFWPILMLVVLVTGIFSGYPVAFVLAGVGVMFAVVTDIPIVFLFVGVSRIYSGVLSNWLLIAIPLFVFMGLMLERSGIAERLLLSLASLFRGIPGGYAFAVVIIGVIMAASTGIIGASVVMIGTMALPTMLKHRYDPKISTGLIASSGTLGILIPPSIMLIILGDQLRVSVGDLFLAAVGPGLLLGSAYIIYILFVAAFQPQRVPVVAKDDKKLSIHFMDLIQDLLIPSILIVSVLGAVVTGVATPTESSAVGALVAMLLAFSSGNLDMPTLRGALRETIIVSAMIIFVMIGATIFSVVFRKLGGDEMIASAFIVEESSPYVVLFLIMALVFILGFFLEWVEIVLVVVPIIAPIMAGLDFGLEHEYVLVWFAIVLSVNLQSSFLTPPFGYALFYLRGIVSSDVSITTIYRGVIPFVLIQLLVLGLVIIFPEISIGLPRYLTR